MIGSHQGNVEIDTRQENNGGRVRHSNVCEQEFVERDFAGHSMEWATEQAEQDDGEASAASPVSTLVLSSRRCMGWSVRKACFVL